MEIRFKKFKPLTNSAIRTINDIVVRGGAIVREKTDFVEIQRQESIAKIDQHGRVEWRSKT